MADTVKIDLEGALAGRHIVVDPDQLDIGLLEDIQSPKFADTLDGLARCIVNGNLPHGYDRAGLRRLKLAELQALVKGVDGQFAMPKS